MTIKMDYLSHSASLNSLESVNPLGGLNRSPASISTSLLELLNFREKLSLKYDLNNSNLEQDQEKGSEF